MLLIPLQLVKSNRDSVHKTRETCLISRGQVKTLELQGMIRIGQMRHEHFFQSFILQCYVAFLNFLLLSFYFRFLRYNVSYFAHAFWQAAFSNFKL